MIIWNYTTSEKVPTGPLLYNILSIMLYSLLYRTRYTTSDDDSPGPGQPCNKDAPVGWSTDKGSESTWEDLGAVESIWDYLRAGETTKMQSHHLKSQRLARISTYFQAPLFQTPNSAFKRVAWVLSKGCDGSIIWRIPPGSLARNHPLYNPMLPKDLFPINSQLFS